MDPRTRFGAHGPPGDNERLRSSKPTLEPGSSAILSSQKLISETELIPEIFPLSEIDNLPGYPYHGSMCAFSFPTRVQPTQPALLARVRFFSFISERKFSPRQTFFISHLCPTSHQANPNCSDLSLLRNNSPIHLLDPKSLSNPAGPGGIFGWMTNKPTKVPSSLGA
jgi:hypothetical protein